jgi:membrane protein implicated in regulation of membrane protease activity
MTRDLRKYARQTNIRLGVGGLFLLFIVGDGLIFLVYGGGAALVGFLCLLAGLFPVLVIVLVMIILDWIAKRANQD